MKTENADLTSGLTIISTAMAAQFIMPVSVEFKPLPDITAYELAQLMPLFFMRGGILPAQVPTDPAVRRHIIVKDPN